MKKLHVALLVSLALVTCSTAFDSVVVFNEIQYHPASDDSSLEFVELYNQNTVDVDLSGWRLSSGIEFEFSEGTVIAGQGYLVVAASPAALEAAAGISDVLGPFSGQLENRGERLRLRNRNDRIMDEIEFNDRFPWPVAPDGSGASLSKIRPSTPGDQAEFWRGSPQAGGTPGEQNFPIQGAGPNTTATRIIELDQEWRFNESGDDLGSAWASDAHGVGGDWRSSQGILAYEPSLAAEIATLLTQPSRNSPYVITYYFEAEFEVTQAEFDRTAALAFTHRIDDGAVFYLNGSEVLRDNMPGGAIGSDTTASGSGEFSVEGPIEVSTSSLQVGTNRISVEVHQGAVGSSDVVFGLEVDRLELLPEAGAPSPLQFSEVSSAAEPSWWLELVNTGTQEIDLTDHVIRTTGTPAEEFVFPSGSLQANAFLVVTSEQLGFIPPSDERLFLLGPGKTTVIDAVDMKNRHQARELDTESHEFLSPLAPSPGAPNPFAFHDEVVINEIMYHHRPDYQQAGLPPSIQPVAIFDYAQVWRYNESAADLGPAWATSSHQVGGDWQSGAGPLGWETASAVLPVPLATVISRPVFNSPFAITHYFETDFALSADQLSTISQLEFTHMVDDGAVFYLNGQEVGRFSMPPGIPGSSTLATAGVEATEQSFTTGPELLVEGINRISVEVHQESTGSSDVVMGLRLASLQEIPSENPPVDYAEQDEEWVELHNRSSAAIDISGWRFDRGIEFEIPGGTILPADGYLVVANDAAKLGAKFPGIGIVGNFSGSLSNSGERLRLLDAVGNPADELHYFDGAPWPGVADAGGSSLELRNPDADNSVASAWSASDSSADSQWRNYSFTMTAQDPIYRPSQSGFHELRLGLLDGGELLLDDVSVIEDPGGTDRELMQNGGFASGSSAWRLLGTHEESEVVVDAGNPVLHVVATARMNYMNNLLETSLKAGGSLVPVQAGTDYRISFRAKWLSGSPQFRAELYYNKVAATFILEQPTTGGTPGEANSNFEANIGPTIDRVAHVPAVPSPNTPVKVECRIADPDGTAGAQLFYAVSGGAFQSTPMTETGEPGIWSGQIPGQSGGTKIQFYIEADDGAASPATTLFPAGGEDSRAMVQIADGRDSSSRQNLRIIMTNADSSAMHNSDDLLQNRRLGCTVITNEYDIAYNCGIRLRGSMFSRRNSGGTGLNIKFPSNRRFRGIHNSITTRTSGRVELIAKHMINHAGGMHDNYNDVAQLIHTTQNGPTRLSMARFSQPYLRGLAGGRGQEGTVFKMEGIRVFQSTTDGNPESQKAPFPIGWVSNFDIADQGDDKEIYRHNMRINSNLDRDDYTSIIAMCKAFSLSGQTLEEEITKTINVDMWMRQFAILSLLGIGDTYTQGNPHNLNMYVRPGDGLVEPMPWDWDFMFNRSTSSSLWGNRNFSKIPARPIFTRLFHGHLHDLINTTYNTTYMDTWLSHYGTVAGENYTGRASYIRDRSNFVLGQLPPQRAFTITTNGGDDFSVDTPAVVLSGDAWIDVRQIRINGSTDAVTPAWIDADTWELSVPVAPGDNTITLAAIDYQGNEIANDSIGVTSTSTVAPASSSNLAISEIMYHPAGGSSHEFIELSNISSGNTVDLSGVRFTDGIEYEFQPGTSLAAGGRLLLVNDLQAFIASYGPGLPVIGTFANGTQLSNGGEELGLVSAGGQDIRRFTYDDAAPWPTAADGPGYSLVLRSPETNPDHGLPQNWRASAGPGGSPGNDDSSPFIGDPEADSDLDGSSDLLEHALGSAPDGASSRPNLSISLVEGGGGPVVQLTFDALSAADNVIITPEISTDLTSWGGDGTPVSTSSHSDGLETRVYQFALPMGSQRLFGRILVQLRE